MRIRRLTIHGFKSFADRTEFEFDADLTGIIGPNGCGKSNIVDAIKWVLGDQRPTAFRSKEMLDVVFKGAEGREAMGMADVRLTLENQGGTALASPTLAGQFAERAEVVVGRRLFRDHESEYVLNDTVVRLKDIRDLLLDTGLGVGAYSVMEQGKIDAVLSANPEDRRSIFEEAAGISRFKFHRKECLRKLEKTEANLARVADILEERGKRLRGLRTQASRALKHREMRTRLRDLRAALAVLERQALLVRQAEILGRIRELEAREQARTAEREAARAAAARIAEERSRLMAEIRELRDRQVAVVGEERAAQERSEGLLRREHDLRRDRDEITGRQGENAQALAQTRLDLADLAARSEELAAEITALEAEATTRREAVRVSRASARELHDAREARRVELLELLHERTRWKNLATEQEFTLQAAREREARLQSQVAQAEQEQRAHEQHGAEVARALEDLVERRRLLEADLALVTERAAALEANVAAAQKLVAEQRESLSALVSRREVLEDLEKALQGMDLAPRQLLAESDAAGSPLLGLSRLVARIECDVAHAPALEAALGVQVQALLVRDLEMGRALIARAHERGLGRVLCVRADSRAGGFASEGPPPAVPGVIGWLRQFVQIPADLQAPVGRLLGEVLLVDSLAVAPAAQAAAGRDLLCVTPDGSFARGDLLLGGGPSDVSAGLIQRRSALHELTDAIATLRAALEGTQTSATDQAGQLTALRAEQRLLGQALEGVRIKEADAAGEARRLVTRQDQLAEDARALAGERQEQSRVRWGALATLGSCLFNTELVRRRETVGEAETRRLTSELDEVNHRLQAAQQADQEQQVRLAARAGERDGAFKKIDLLNRNLAEQEGMGRKLQADAELCVQRATEAAQELQELRERQQELRAEREEVAGRRDGREADDRACAEQEAAALATVQDAERHLDEVREARMQARLSEQELGHELGREEERLRADFGVELRRLTGEVRGCGLVDGGEPFGPGLQGADPELLAGVELPMLAGPPLPAESFRADQECAQVWSRLLPERAADAVDGFPAVASETVDEWRRESETLQSRLDRLGPVNLQAIDELAVEEDEFQKLEREDQDLKAARKSLLDTLRRINEESRTLFEKTFNEARRNFQDIFRKLFQGGRADINMTVTDDPLESGIDIMAKPPGKELQSINLLSGGERSLTALALLFAVFKVKPSPFCILDEVDAALDDTNVDRFLRVLRDFVGPTQFLVVTHHKHTMLACQVLYGITMQKKGVTTRLAVRLQDVESGRASDFVAGDLAALDQKRIAGEEPVGYGDTPPAVVQRVNAAPPVREAAEQPESAGGAAAN